jgi:hypothetical protein
VQVFFTPLSQALRLIIHLGEPLPEDKLSSFTFDYGTLALFFALPYGLMMWTNGVGASTGMFVPALAVGATGARASHLAQAAPLLPELHFHMHSAKTLLVDSLCLSTDPPAMQLGTVHLEEGCWQSGHGCLRVD